MPTTTMGIVPVASLAGRAAVGTERYNDIRFAPDQFSGQLAEAIRTPVPVMPLNGEVLSLREAKFTQRLQERVEHVECGIGKLRPTRRDDAYPGHLRRRLRTRR